MSILFPVLGVLAIGSGAAVIVRRCSARRTARGTEQRRPYSSSGGSRSSGPYYPSGGYDAPTINSIALSKRFEQPEELRLNLHGHPWMALAGGTVKAARAWTALDASRSG